MDFSKLQLLIDCRSGYRPRNASQNLILFSFPRLLADPTTLLHHHNKSVTVTVVKPTDTKDISSFFKEVTKKTGSNEVEPVTETLVELTGNEDEEADTRKRDHGEKDEEEPKEKEKRLTSTNETETTPEKLLESQKKDNEEKETSSKVTEEIKEELLKMEDRIVSKVGAMIEEKKEKKDQDSVTSFIDKIR